MLLNIYSEAKYVEISGIEDDQLKRKYVTIHSKTYTENFESIAENYEC